MYYFYYRECCSYKKKTAIAYKNLIKAELDLICDDHTPDTDIQGYVTNKNMLPDYVKNICGEVWARRVLCPDRHGKLCYVWRKSCSLRV